ncbi:MAG: hypothetical protein EU547_03920 [Promethearchaeota archaeon]|nr:MAG: hypothetical protein EU547_03920 [Candidatus Lokiarchaeota archaeon]
MAYIENLGYFDVLRLSLGLIFTIISMIIGIIMILKYFSLNRSNLILVGITWIGLAFPYVPDAINLLLITFSDFFLPEQIYLIITISILPIPLCCWLVAISDILYFQKQKIVAIISISISIIFEIVFFSLLFLDYEYFIGDPYTNGKIVVQTYSPFIQIYFLTCLGLFVLTGLIFGFQAVKSSDAEIKLKGKFLLGAFILLLFALAIEVIIEDPSPSIVIARSIMRSVSALLFYLGFILPNTMKKRLLKHNS